MKDSLLVNDAVAKNFGAQGVIRLNLNKESLQIIVGPRAEIIAGAMRTVLASGARSAAAWRDARGGVICNDLLKRPCCR